MSETIEVRLARLEETSRQHLTRIEDMLKSHFGRIDDRYANAAEKIGLHDTRLNLLLCVHNLTSVRENPCQTTT